MFSTRVGLSLVLLLITVGVRGDDRRGDVNFLRRQIDNLKSANESEQERAAYQLKQAGAKAVPLLIERLADKDRDFASSCASILADQGEIALPELIKAVAGSDSEARGLAASVMTLMDWKILDRAVPALIRALDDPDASTRQMVVRALMLSKDARGVMPALKLLTDKDRRVRRTVVLSLQWIEELGAPAVPQLLEMIRKTPDSKLDDEFTELIYGALMFIGRPALPLIIGELQDPTLNEKRRLNLVDTIRSMASCKKPIEMGPAIPFLISLLDDQSEAIRMYAIQGLAAIGETAAKAIKPMKQRLTQAKGKPRLNLAHALFQIEPALKNQHLAEIIEGLSDPSDDAKVATMWLLQELDRQSQAKAVPKLIELLSSRNSQIRFSACQTLDHFGSIASEAHPALAKLAKDDPDRGVRLTAEKAAEATRPSRP